MRSYLSLSILFLISIGFSQKEYNSNDLIEMDNGLWTEKFSDEPITGKVYGYFGEVKPYKKVYIGNLVNGKKIGKWKSYYHSTGKKIYEETFKDGKEDGLRTFWYQNGQKYTEGTYKNGKEDGLGTFWYKNGQKSKEGTYKDGKRVGVHYEWYENGQKKWEVIFKEGNKVSSFSWHLNRQKKSKTFYKDGKSDGIETSWYENGQKKEEWIHKDGKMISIKCYYEDGNECECNLFGFGCI